MRTMDFVTGEALRRPRKSIAGISFVLLGVGIFVACQTINKALHDRTKEQLLRFGANIIVQPKGKAFNQYSGPAGGERFLPERYAAKVSSIPHHKMLVAVSPKLYERFAVDGGSLSVVGITPDEQKAKPWWMVEHEVLADRFPKGKEVLLGHHLAARLGAGVSELTLGGETFRICGVLDETGSPDDFVAFMPLAALQKISGKNGMISLIEVSTSCIACKAMNIHDVAEDIDEALPADAEVMLVKQIAEAQMGTLRKVQGFTLVTSLAVLTFCVFLLVNFAAAAVEERRREIGVLLAMGMPARKIQWIFVSRILILAAVGGLLGYAVGSGVSVLLGPLLADAKVSMIPYLLPVALAISLGLGAISSIVPVRRISRLDPVEALREF